MSRQEVAAKLRADAEALRAVIRPYACGCRVTYETIYAPTMEVIGRLEARAVHHEKAPT